MLSPLIADEPGAVGAAEQGRQGHARELGHGWFHMSFGHRSNTTAIPHTSRGSAITSIDRDSRESGSRRVPLVTVRSVNDRYLADREGARCQGTGFGFRRLPPSAVQTRIDGDGQAGVQVNGPLQHQGPFAFIAGFHVHTVTRVYRPDHRSEVLFGRAKGLLRPKAYGPFGPPLGACPTLTFLLRRTICSHLRRSRPKQILNVFQRIHLRFFQACGLASGRTSFAS